MANISFYKYLETAFRHRLFSPKGQTATPDTRFTNFGYNLTFKQIFYYARKVLPKFYTNEFPDTEEGNLQMAKKVLEKLDRHEDPELTKYYDPTQAPTEYEQIIAEAQQESKSAGAGPAQTPADSSGGGPNIPSISAPAIHPIFRTKPPIVETPKPDIAIANKSGYVAEAPPTQFHVTDKAGNIQATYSREPVPAATQPKLVIANKSGVVTETPPSKISLARSDGTITGEHHIPGRRRFNFSSLRPSASFVNAAKNFGSKAGVFFQRNAGKYLGSDRVLGFLGKMGNTGINALSGITNIGARPGGLFSSVGQRFGGGGRGSGFFGKAGGVGGRGGSLAGKAKTRGGLIFAISLIGFMLLVGGLTAFAPNPIPGSATPITGTTPTSPSYGLDYTLPLKNPSVQPLDIKDQIKAFYPGAKLEYWDKIVQSSITNGFNPALTLALWIEETGASQTTLIKNGGSEIPVNGAFTRGHLGCAPTEDQTIDESLSCLFKFVAANNFTNDQFADFMANYSGGPANDPFSNNPNFTKNIKDWYSKLVPSGPGALTPTSTPLPPGTVASCPVAGGKISTPSYEASNQLGHCGSSYNYSCRYCPAFGDDKHSRRAKAIDVPTNGQSVILPTVEGQEVTWTLIVGPYSIDSDEGGGVGYTFRATLKEDAWYLDMLHLNQSSMMEGANYRSGTPVATTAIEHVHMTMGKNLSTTRPVAGSITDCDPNWLASDFLCQ